MRILYFSKGYSPHDRRFLIKMVESGHEIFFLSLDNIVPHPETRNIPDGVHIVTGLEKPSDPNDPEKLLFLLPSFEKIIHTISPDIIQAGPVQTCGFLTALIDFHPFILVSWGSDILVDASKNDLSDWISRFTLIRSDKILSDCNAVQEKIHRMIPYNDKDIIQFPWGVNLQLFKPGYDRLNLKTKHEWKNCFLILSTRMWEPIYGIDIVLNSFYLAYKSNPELRLVLLGDGSQALEIKKFIRKHNLETIIILPGIIPEDLIADYYRAVNVYLSCSLSDGSSVSLLEAMATGLPVIVSDIPGNREWVKNKKNGFLVSAGNFKDFSAALINISTKSITERQEISYDNRSLIEKKADWDKNVLKLIYTYDLIKKNDLPKSRHTSNSKKNHN
jgi:L-malate glycosyltransferase